MADLTRDVNEEIGEERAGRAAPPAGLSLDSTTLLVKRVVTARNTAAASNLKDSNQALDQVLPDV